MSRCSLSKTLIVFLVVMAVAPLTASTVMQLNLAEMVERAHAIYRGRVVSAQEGTVAAGGTQLNVVTYRIQVEELFRGDVSTEKGVTIAELTMLGKQPSVRVGNLLRMSPLPKMPQLTVGRYYLVIASQPSAIGLSTTVGLGQGCFTIHGWGKDETAVNEANNEGLFRDMAPPGTLSATASYSGPMPYSELAGMIRSLIGQ